MEILSVGMMCCDIPIKPVPIDIIKRDSVNIEKPNPSCGGDALNVAMALAKLGEDVSIAGVVGDDANGDFIKKKCSEAGINTDGIKTLNDYATATTYALIDENGERHFLTDKSIFPVLNGSHISNSQIKDADIVYFGSAMALEGMDNGGIVDVFKRAHSFGKITAMDAAIDSERVNLDWESILDPALLETDIFMPSIIEAELISGESELEKIAEYFEQYNFKVLIIKLGSKGCYFSDGSTKQIVPTLDWMPVVDTTGAGDSFVAAFLSCISRNWGYLEAVKFANAVASISVGAVGGTEAIPDFETAYEFFIKNTDKKS